MIRARAALVPCVLTAAVAAQVVLDPCRPPLVAPASAATELGAAALGVDQVAQLCVVPDGNGGFEGVATVRRSGSTTGFDLLHFSWSGPGTPPTPTTLADGLNGAGDEFQASLAPTRRAIVFDSPVGARLATRGAVGQPFAAHPPLTGVPVGTIDPALGRVDGRDVVFFVAAPGRIAVGDVDLVPASPTFGHVTGVRTAVDGSSIPGLVTLHSPSPQADSAGDTVGLVLGAHVTNTGSDAYWQSAPVAADFPIAGSGSLLFALDEHGADWLANPLVDGGTAVFARGLGDRYVDPVRYDFFSMTSDSVPSVGGTARHVAALPLGASTSFAGVLHAGFRSGLPVDPRLLGLRGAGLLCVTPLLASPAAAFQSGELATSLPIPPLPAGLVIDLECVAIDLASGAIWISNVAALEIRP